MLGGLDPVIIFQFSKLLDTDYSDLLSKIPLVSDVKSFVDQPPIPIYLSESRTGLMIDSEDKNVDISTDVNTSSSGGVDTNQSGVNSSVTINIMAKRGSIGITLLSAMIDTVFEKLTSKEYAISYLHEGTTIFRGVLQSYQVNQTADNDLLSIELVLSKGEKNPTKIKVVGAVQPTGNEEVLQAIEAGTK